MLPDPKPRPRCEREQAVSVGLERAGLGESHRSLVSFYVDRRDNGWRDCCGSGCDPCMDRVACAVDTARTLL